MIGLAALFGALSGISGAFISSTTERLPTGPTVVVCITVFAGLSLLFAPNRGIVWQWLKNARNRRRIQVERVMGDMYALAQHHQGHEQEHGHTAQVLQAMSMGLGGVQGSLNVMEQRGWARQNPAGEWSLTSAGLTEAKRLADEEERRRTHDE
jgi:manganese/zinc/iron transport system permease protein